jgi:hypothetical protein
MSCTWRPVRSFGSTLRLLGKGNDRGERGESVGAPCAPRALCATATLTRRDTASDVTNAADRGLIGVFTA